jgi:hypothetical protein
VGVVCLAYQERKENEDQMEELDQKDLQEDQEKEDLMDQLVSYKIFDVAILLIT